MTVTRHLGANRHTPRWGRRLTARRLSGLAAAIGISLIAPGAGAVDPNEQQEQKARQAKATTKAEANLTRKTETPKRWFVDGLFNTHWLVIRDNYPRNDVYHQIYARGGYKVPKVGRLDLRLAVTRKYVADPGESGVLFGDVRLTYSRGFQFKLFDQEFGGRGYFYWTFPTSKISDKQGNISRPTLIVALSKSLPHGFDLFVRPFVRRNWDRYAEAEGGAPNQKWLLGYDINVNHTLQVHKKLSLGASLGQYWYDRYDSREGLTHPWRSFFWWEAYVGYSVVRKPVALDAYLAISSGHDTIRDGVWRVYWLHRDQTEMYLSLRARY